jgi:hypothetical protein
MHMLNALTEHRIKRNERKNIIRNMSLQDTCKIQDGILNSILKPLFCFPIVLIFSFQDMSLILTLADEEHQTYVYPISLIRLNLHINP